MQSRQVEEHILKSMWYFTVKTISRPGKSLNIKPIYTWYFHAVIQLCVCAAAPIVVLSGRVPDKQGHQLSSCSFSVAWDISVL